MYSYKLLIIVSYNNKVKQLWINSQSIEDSGYTSQNYTLGKYILEKYTLEIEVWKLLVIAFRRYITSRGLPTLCNDTDTVEIWKCDWRTDQLTDRLSGVVARDAYVSKNWFRIWCKKINTYSTFSNMKKHDHLFQDQSQDSD